MNVFWRETRTGSMAFPLPPPPSHIIFRDYAASGQAVLEAARDAIVSLGYRIAGTEDAAIAFTTPRSWWTWAGQSMRARVVSLGGATRIEFTGHMVRLQLYDWGEAEANGRKVLDRMALGGALAQNLVNPARQGRNVVAILVMVLGPVLLSLVMYWLVRPLFDILLP